LCFLLISSISFVLGGAPYPAYSFSSPEKANLVKYHNFVRSNWGMGPLKNGLAVDGWNDDIAANAQKHAQKCIWQHSDPTTRQSAADANGNYAWQWGENMAQAGTTDTAAKFPFVTLASHVDLWKGEEANWDCTKTEYYDFNTGASEDGCSKTPDSNGNLPMCGHFTQVVWSSTFEIGCALIDCPVGTVMASPFRGQFLVCQYNVAGNSAGSHPLNAGGSIIAPDNSRISGSYSKCPKPYATTAAVSALTAEDAGVATQDSTAHQSQDASDGISIPMGGFVAVAVVCGLVVFLVILLVIAFIVVVSKKNNDWKAESLL